MTRLRLAVAGLLAALSLPAAGFVRETTVPQHPESGLCLWRADRHVTVQINAGSAAAHGTPPCGDAATAEALAANSLAAWGGATVAGQGGPCTDLSITAGATTTLTAIGRDGVNLLVFRSGLCSDLPASEPCLATPGACAAATNCWEHGITIIGLTTTTFDTATGEILDSDVEINGWDGTTTHNTRSQYLTCGAGLPACTAPLQSVCVNEDVGSVVTHEAGHLLGLDHTCQYPAPFDSCTAPGANSHTMDPYGQLGDTGKRVLSQDDVAGVCAIYPVGGPTATCRPPPPRAAGGCQTGAGGGEVALLLAGLALLRRMSRK
jgi:hypothetical protein